MVYKSGDRDEQIYMPSCINTISSVSFIEYKPAVQIEFREGAVIYAIYIAAGTGNTCVKVYAGPPCGPRIFAMPIEPADSSWLITGAGDSQRGHLWKPIMYPVQCPTMSAARVAMAT